MSEHRRMRRGRQRDAELELRLREIQRDIWETAARDFTRYANRAKRSGDHEKAAEWAAAVEDAHHKASCQKYWRAA